MNPYHSPTIVFRVPELRHMILQKRHTLMIESVGRLESFFGARSVMVQNVCTGLAWCWNSCWDVMVTGKGQHRFKLRFRCDFMPWEYERLA